MDAMGLSSFRRAFGGCYTGLMEPTLLYILRSHQGRYSYYLFTDNISKLACKQA